MAEGVEVKNQCASTGTALPQVPGGGRRKGVKETRAITLNKVTVRFKDARSVTDTSGSVTDPDAFGGRDTEVGDAETWTVLVVTVQFLRLQGHG